MSKIFSLVDLETTTGISDSGYMGGMPDRDDIEKSKLYQELLEDCGGPGHINVNVRSYIYGEGESENASEEDLEYIRSQENFTSKDEVEILQSFEFTIYPEQSQEMQIY